MSNRTVLVTGGAGFIGSELVRQLIAEGRSVVALDSFATGSPENLEGVSARRLELVAGDVRDAGLLARVLPRVSAVYHLACLGLRHSLHSPEENRDVNVTGTLRVLEAARTAGIERFVHVSSSEVYGSAQIVPMREDHPTNPTTPYGAGKLAGERWARRYFSLHRLPVAVVRPFNSFGPRSHHEGDRGEAIPRFLLRAMAGRPLTVFGDGSQTRDFTYVADTARGIRLAGETEGVVGRTINLGGGREISIGELARTIVALYGRAGASVVHAAARPGDLQRLRADPRPARRLLGYAPRVALEDGLESLHAWYLAKGVSPERLLEDERERNWLADSVGVASG